MTAKTGKTGDWGEFERLNKNKDRIKELIGQGYSSSDAVRKAKDEYTEELQQGG